VTSALYLIDTSALFRILQQQLREAWSEDLAAGAHRSAGAIDMLVAATAERNHLTALCDDHDYLTVARATGHPVKLVTDI
jgi:predicted nuclease of predicted toxin-antitoxin system